MNNSNYSDRENLLAGFFGKKYGKFLYSGTLAVETALIAGGVGKGDYVLIPNYVCYRVLLSTVRLGAIPIIVSPANGYTLTANDIAPVIEKYTVKVAVLVHHLGLPVDIGSIKKICHHGTVIIEDASQAWDIVSTGNKLGTESDYVVTSFGISKPLSLGIGGAIFGDDQNFLKLIDNYTSKSRVSEKALLPYGLPESFNINVENLIKTGNKIVSHQREIAKILSQGLEGTKWEFWQVKNGDNPTWHRFPMWTDDLEQFDKIIEQADIQGIKYEKPHRITLDKTPMAGESVVVVDNLGKKYYHMLVKTRSNLLINIKKWIKTIE